MSEQQAYEQLEQIRDKAFRIVTDRRGLKRDKAMALCRAFHNRDDDTMQRIATGRRLIAYNQVRAVENAFTRAFG